MTHTYIDKAVVAGQFHRDLREKVIRGEMTKEEFLRIIGVSESRLKEVAAKWDPMNPDILKK